MSEPFGNNPFPQRIAPLERADYTPEQAVLAGDRDSLNFIKVLLRHPEMFKAFLPWCAKVGLQSDLPMRDREIAILRVFGMTGEFYEMVHHKEIATRFGFTDAEYDAARTGDGAGLDDWERTILRATEELVRDQRVSDANWQALAARYSEIQMMEFVFLVGNYTTVAMLSKSFGFQLEDDFAATWKPN